MTVTWTIACRTHAPTVEFVVTQAQTASPATAVRLQLAIRVQRALTMPTIAQLRVVSTAGPALTRAQNNGNAPARLATLGLVARLILMIVYLNPAANTAAALTAAYYLTHVHVTVGTVESHALSTMMIVQQVPAAVVRLAPTQGLTRFRVLVPMASLGLSARTILTTAQRGVLETVHVAITVCSRVFRMK